MVRNWTLVTCDYPPMKGGVARYLSDLVQASQEVIKVIVPLDHKEADQPVERRAFFGSGLIRWWPLVGLMRKLGKETDTRVLVSHILPIGTAAWIASWFGGAAYIILFHGLDLRLSQRSHLKRWLTKRIVSRAKEVCVNSKFVAAECEAAFPGTKPVILTPGYEPHVLPDRDEARSSLGIHPEEIIILNVARLIPRKGLERLIEVLPTLPANVRTISIGDGPDRGRLEERAQSRQARITFLGAADDELRDLWYAAADIFVFPVRADGEDVEGYGMVCLEASAAGLPVIVGKNGGAPETIIEGETGFSVDVDQPGELLAALQRLVQDSSLRQRLGEQGKVSVRKTANWSDRWKALSEL